MNMLYVAREIKTMEKAPPFSFTKDMPVMRFDTIYPPEHFPYGDLLFDLSTDPEQNNLITDNPSLKKEMDEKLRTLMKENDAPKEQFQRLGYS
jgi:hypothetical protein